MTTVCIAADICPIGGNSPLFASGDVRALYGDLLEEIRGADLSIVNLECPLIDRSSPIPKTGPTFGEPGDRVAGIRDAGIDVVSLANNHIMDHGPAGLENTLCVCREAGIATVGAGENLEAARRILVRQAGDTRVGILSMAEHEFSIGSKNGWGANPLDLVDAVRNIRERAGDFDYLIVLLHGGFEFAEYPSPRIRNTCRFLVEMGANAVFVQHTHCLGGYEEYREGLIFYGQGALVMDEAIYRRLPDFHQGYLVKLTLDGSRLVNMELVPFQQSDGSLGARRMSPPDAEAFLAALEAKRNLIRDDDFIENQWLEFCRQRRHDYLSALLAHNRVLSKLNARGLIERLLYRRRALLGVRNCVCCETHREVLETIFNQLDGK